MNPAWQLLRLASPQLPIGGYSYSQGLEMAVEQGLVANAESAQRWISDQLLLNLARFEAPLLLAHCQAAALEDWGQLHSLAALHCSAAYGLLKLGAPQGLLASGGFQGDVVAFRLCRVVVSGRRAMMDQDACVTAPWLDPRQGLCWFWGVWPGGRRTTCYPDCRRPVHAEI